MSDIIQRTKTDIKSLRLQGATAVALASLTALAKYARSLPATASLRNRVLTAAETLAFARPTEPLTQNLYYFLKAKLPLSGYDQSGFLPGFKKLLREYKGFIETAEQAIIRQGQRLIKNKNNILTHCHSSTVEKIFYAAKRAGRRFEVYADETRPLFQGRITARRLARGHIPVTQVADSASGFLISEYSGKDLMMDKVIVGADALLQDGSIVNKIGTYDIAASCSINNVPFYTAVTLLKYDSQDNVTIEKRSDQEIWPRHPRNVKILNFAFDRVGAPLVTGLITEAGIIKASEVASKVLKVYPWLKR